MKTCANFPGLLEAFFTDRLMRQRKASAHTIASYSDTFRLLLEFVQQRLKKAPSTLTIGDLPAPLIVDFLDSLEKDRGNSARSRNIRLAAIRSFFRYAALHQPNYSALIQRILAIPAKRHDRTEVAFLTRPEIDVLLAAPDLNTWSGRRDRALLMLAMQTGLRVSELTGLRCEDLVLGRGSYIHCMGKGRKERCTPLVKETHAVLRDWQHERRGSPSEPLFPNARGGPLSRDGVEYLLAKHIAIARPRCPTLSRKRISPHVLRHTAAMRLRHAGVDLPSISLVLGHESLQSTQIYTHADIELKERVLAMASPFAASRGRYHPTDRTMAFLKSL